MDVSIANLAWACVALATMLGWFFGAFALLLSAATGRSSVAVWATTGLAVAGYFGYTLLLAAGEEASGWWSPFRAYFVRPAADARRRGWQPTGSPSAPSPASPRACRCSSAATSGSRP